MPTFRAGYDLGVTFQKTGAVGATTLLITAWSWVERVQKLIATHSGSAGVAACIAGVLDGDGTIEANVDIAALPNAAAPGIVAGAKGMIVFDTGTTTDYTLPVMIESVNWKSQVGGMLAYSFNVALDSLTGSITRPAA